MYVLDVEFFERVVGCKDRFVEVFFQERVGVKNHDGAFFEMVGVYFERGGVHRYKYIGFVACVVHIFGTDSYLKAGNSVERTLRGSYFGRKIRECGYFVSENGGKR